MFMWSEGRRDTSLTVALRRQAPGTGRFLHGFSGSVPLFMCCLHQFATLTVLANMPTSHQHSPPPFSTWCGDWHKKDFALGLSHAQPPSLGRIGMTGTTKALMPDARMHRTSSSTALSSFKVTCTWKCGTCIHYTCRNTQARKAWSPSKIHIAKLAMYIYIYI